MNYDIAKQLKDAGFVQKGKCSCTISGFSPSAHSDCIAVPTLSELIEACGTHLDLQIRENKSVAHKLIGSMDITRADGSSPEEAVAKLWLALHTSK